MIAVPGWKSASYLPNCSGGIKLLIVCLPVCLSVCLFVCLSVRYCWSDCGIVVRVCYSEVGGSMGGHLWSKRTYSHIPYQSVGVPAARIDSLMTESVEYAHGRSTHWEERKRERVIYFWKCAHCGWGYGQHAVPEHGAEETTTNRIFGAIATEHSKFQTLNRQGKKAI